MDLKSKQEAQGFRPATGDEQAAWVAGDTPAGAVYRLVAGVGLMVKEAGK